MEGASPMHLPLESSWDHKNCRGRPDHGLRQEIALGGPRLYFSRECGIWTGLDYIVITWIRRGFEAKVAKTYHGRIAV
jgi:hypothetical protein